MAEFSIVPDDRTMPQHGISLCKAFRVDLRTLALSVTAAAAIFRFKAGTNSVLVACCTAGVILFLSGVHG